MKKRYIVMALIVICLIIGCYIMRIYQKKYQETDMYRFKEEYNLDVDCPVKYLKIEDIEDIFAKNQAVIYIGDANDETCHEIVPLLVDVINKYQIKDFYYLNIENSKSVYSVEDNKLVKTKEGDENYYQLLEKLDPFLEENIIKQDNKEYKTGEKKINIPFVITIKDGNIKNYHEKTINLNDKKTVFDIHNNEHRLKLIDIYSDMVVEILN